MIAFGHVTKRYEDGTMTVEDLNLSCAMEEAPVLLRQPVEAHLAPSLHAGPSDFTSRPNAPS